jgi:hypothetical protein
MPRCKPVECKMEAEGWPRCPATVCVEMAAHAGSAKEYQAEADDQPTQTYPTGAATYRGGD